MKPASAIVLVLIGHLASAHRLPAMEPGVSGRPNILFITIDDMNDWTGFLGGHPQAQTPNMDALARKGVNFTNAHCPAPGCSPSRNAVLFGVEPATSGLYAFYDHAAIPEEVMEPYTAITEFFRQHGYNTYGAGKIHHRRSAGPGEWTEYYAPKRKIRLKFDDREGYRQGRSGKMNFSPSLNPLEDHRDYRNTSYGVEVLGRRHDKPFFLAVGIVKPHLPFVAPKRFFDLYPDDIEPPSIKSDDGHDIPAVGRAMVKAGDDRRFKEDKAWTRVRRAYLACISWADYNVGRLIDTLEASPYARNTIVVLWSDHGYALGEKRHFRKFALWEEVTRVPFLVWDTRDPAAGREVKGPVSLINIYRTLAELSGLNPPAYVDGFSLVPQFRDPSAPLKEPARCTWGRGNMAVRDADWRYIRYYDGSEELYRHRDDPQEWTNLAEFPQYAQTRNRLASFLPAREAPLVRSGVEPWSVPVSADKPLKSNKATGHNP